MYFKINRIQKDKYTGMGMINISASFYLEKGDKGWDKYQADHHVIVPVFPPAGYPGAVNEIGVPLDKTAYTAWVNSLPKIERDNPFCNHAIQFEPTATEEEILWCFEWALALTQQNYLLDDLECKKGSGAKAVNQSIDYLKRRESYILNKGTLTPLGLEKIANAELKVTALKDVDFTKVETIANYRVK